MQHIVQTQHILDPDLSSNTTSRPTKDKENNETKKQNTYKQAGNSSTPELHTLTHKHTQTHSKCKSMLPKWELFTPSSFINYTHKHTHSNTQDAQDP